MTISADSNGVLRGKFTIPEGVLAGTKLVQLTGSGGSHGEAVFVGEGTLVTNVLQNQTLITQNFYDPLAQTFSLAEENQIGGVEIIVTAKGSTPISVQIRETQTGFPTQKILVDATLQPSQINVGAWNRFEFAQPVRILPNVEYAIVVLCNDPVGAVAIAELGKWDNTNGRWVTQQPYQVGVLLSSSNASTWTAHQDRDMTFRLLARRYTQTTREIDLGTVTATDATDLLVLAMSDNPSTGADSELLLTMPDSSVISASDQQGVNLATNVSGQISLKARLRATQKASGMLYPGTQIVVGKLATSADYVSRAIDADAAGCNVRVIFDGVIPSGAGVSVYICGVDAGDNWQEVALTGVPRPLGDGLYEYQHFQGNVQEAKLRVKLSLTGTPAARPFVYNLRVSVTEKPL